jgi:hypothetical protein
MTQNPRTAEVVRRELAGKQEAENALQKEIIDLTQELDELEALAWVAVFNIETGEFVWHGFVSSGGEKKTISETRMWCRWNGAGVLIGIGRDATTVLDINTALLVSKISTRHMFAVLPTKQSAEAWGQGMTVTWGVFKIDDAEEPSSGKPRDDVIDAEFEEA